MSLSEIEKIDDDAIHGKIEFKYSIIYDLIKTPEFQRLQKISQLGLVYLVFPNTEHTRYEHCIGVCHLAGRLIDLLEKNSKIEIETFYKKCVMIAALLHDVGHPAFSHLWEKFTKKILKNDDPCDHEKISVDITDRIFEKIKLSENPEEHHVGVEIIKNLIVGDQKKLNSLFPKKFNFLSEIINNKYSEIDIDKWDYMLRDRHYSNITTDTSFDFFDIFKRARISYTADENGSHIVYHEDDYENASKLFQARVELHKKLYKQAKVISVEEQLIDILIFAEKTGYKFKNEYLLSKIHTNLDIFMEFMVDGRVLDEIYSNSNNEDLRDKINSFKEKRFYDFEVNPTDSANEENETKPLLEIKVKNKQHVMLKQKIFYKELENGEILLIQKLDDNPPEENVILYSIYINRDNNNN